MQRQDQRRVLGDHQVRRAPIATPCAAQLVDLGDQRPGVEHHAVADDAELARPHDARRQQRQLVDRAVDDQRVPGVVPALEARDHVGALGQPVDDLALALVAPLGADDHHVAHAPVLPRRGRRPRPHGLTVAGRSGATVPGRCPRRRDRLECPPGGTGPDRRIAAAAGVAADAAREPDVPGDLDRHPRLELRRAHPGGRRGLADDVDHRLRRHGGAGAGVDHAAGHDLLAGVGRDRRQFRPPPGDACGAALHAGGVGRAGACTLWRTCSRRGRCSPSPS